MTSFSDVFGGDTLPPSEYQYRAVALTADVTLGFPATTDGTDVLSSFLDVTASAGPFTITLPPANTSSTGQDTLIRNVGANTFLVNDNGGNLVATVAVGEVKYLYVTNNSTATGVWAVFTFGTGTSGADASALAGQGLKALLNQLVANQTVNVTASTVDMTAASDRAEVFVFNGGSVTANLPDVVDAGDGWFVDVVNQGSGTITVDNADGALIDGATSKLLTPSESCRFHTDGSAWYTVGFGRSVEFVFTKLVKDISAGSPFTLTSAEASNKLFQFIGTPAANVVVNVPAVVSIYYVQCAYTGSYTLQIKTAAGMGVTLQNTDRTILYCDGVNVVAAQTVAAGSNVSVVDGSAAAPAINFSSDTDTGIYRAGTNSLGIAAGGVQSATFTTTGMNDTPVGATTPRTGAFTTLSTTGTATIGGAANVTGAITGASASFTAPLPATSGGTGFASYAIGDILYASAAGVLSKRADVATGNALISGGVGVAPSYGKIGLTTHVSGTLPIANGGTGQVTAAAALTALSGVRYTLTTGSAVIPNGTTAQRDGSPVAGYFRYNSSTDAFEGYLATGWGSIGGGATGAGGDKVFVETNQTVTTSYTLTTNFNAMTAGPVTINGGVTVTIPTGAVWSIV
jgi:hypothetical protein